MIPRLLRCVPLLLLAACATRPPAPAPGGVPADFRLQVIAAGATNPHCDFDLAVDAAGRLDYTVDHRGTQSAERRGRTDLPADAVRALLDAVEAGGLADLPPALSPEAGGEERGVVTFRVRVRGRERTVVADHAGTAGTDGVLATLFRVTPRRVWRVPGAE